MIAPLLAITLALALYLILARRTQRERAARFAEMTPQQRMEVARQKFRQYQPTADP